MASTPTNNPPSAGSAPSQPPGNAANTGAVTNTDIVAGSTNVLHSPDPGARNADSDAMVHASRSSSTPRIRVSLPPPHPQTSPLARLSSVAAPNTSSPSPPSSNSSAGPPLAQADALSTPTERRPARRRGRRRRSTATTVTGNVGSADGSESDSSTVERPARSTTVGDSPRPSRIPQQLPSISESPATADRSSVRRQASSDTREQGRAEPVLEPRSGPWRSAEAGDSGEEASRSQLLRAHATDARLPRPLGGTGDEATGHAASATRTVTFASSPERITLSPTARLLSSSSTPIADPFFPSSIYTSSSSFSTSPERHLIVRQHRLTNQDTLGYDSLVLRWYRILRRERGLERDAALEDFTSLFAHGDRPGEAYCLAHWRYLEQLDVERGHILPRSSSRVHPSFRDDYGGDADGREDRGPPTEANGRGRDAARGASGDDGGRTGEDASAPVELTDAPSSTTGARGRDSSLGREHLSRRGDASSTRLGATATGVHGVSVDSSLPSHFHSHQSAYPSLPNTSSPLAHGLPVPSSLPNTSSPVAAVESSSSFVQNPSHVPSREQQQSSHHSLCAASCPCITVTEREGTFSRARFDQLQLDFQHLKQQLVEQIDRVVACELSQEATAEEVNMLAHANADKLDLVLKALNSVEQPSKGVSFAPEAARVAQDGSAPMFMPTSVFTPAVPGRFAPVDLAASAFPVSQPPASFTSAERAARGGPVTSSNARPGSTPGYIDLYADRTEPKGGAKWPLAKDFKFDGKLSSDHRRFLSQLDTAKSTRAIPDNYLIGLLVDCNRGGQQESNVEALAETLMPLNADWPTWKREFCRLVETNDWRDFQRQRLEDSYYPDTVLDLPLESRAPLWAEYFYDLYRLLEPTCSFSDLTSALLRRIPPGMKHDLQSQQLVLVPTDRLAWCQQVAGAGQRYRSPSWKQRPTFSGHDSSRDWVRQKYKKLFDDVSEIEERKARPSDSSSRFRPRHSLARSSPRVLANEPARDRSNQSRSNARFSADQLADPSRRPRPGVKPVPAHIKCFKCQGNHYVDDCPDWPTVAGLWDQRMIDWALEQNGNPANRSDDEDQESEGEEQGEASEHPRVAALGCDDWSENEGDWTRAQNPLEVGGAIARGNGEREIDSICRLESPELGLSVILPQCEATYDIPTSQYDHGDVGAVEVESWSHQSQSTDETRIRECDDALFAGANEALQKLDDLTGPLIDNRTQFRGETVPIRIEARDASRLGYQGPTFAELFDEAEMKEWSDYCDTGAFDLLSLRLGEERALDICRFWDALPPRTQQLYTLAADRARQHQLAWWSEVVIKRLERQPHPKGPLSA